MAKGHWEYVGTYKTVRMMMERADSWALRSRLGLFFQASAWVLDNVLYFQGVYVHSKLVVGKDVGFTISSANINDRSLGLKASDKTGDLELGIHLKGPVGASEILEKTVYETVTRNGCMDEGTILERMRALSEDLNQLLERTLGSCPSRSIVDFLGKRTNKQTDPIYIMSGCEVATFELPCDHGCSEGSLIRGGYFEMKSMKSMMKPPVKSQSTGCGKGVAVMCAMDCSPLGM